MYIWLYYNIMVVYALIDVEAYYNVYGEFLTRTPDSNCAKNIIMYNNILYDDGVAEHHINLSTEHP